jgi:predicted dehydrogenase
VSGAVCLIAGRDQRPLVEELAAGLEVASVAGHGRIPGIPSFDTVDSALSATDDNRRIACFLSPYRNLERDVGAALEAGFHVLCRGLPATTSDGLEAVRGTARKHGLGLSWGGLYEHGRAHARMLKASAADDFGKPVFLRAAVEAAGVGMTAIWWALADACDQAAALTRSDPTRLHVTATSAGRVAHATATVSFANRATAQLSAIRAGAPEGDYLFLGSGGILTYAAAANRVVAFGPGGQEVRQPPGLRPEPEWLRAFCRAVVEGVAVEPTPSEETAGALALLRSMRKARRSGEVVEVRLR